MRHILLVLAAAALVAGCSSAPGPTTSAGRSPSAGSSSGLASSSSAAPRVGQCRQLTAREVPPPTNSNPTVSCSAPHTARTFMVATTPASVPLKPGSKSFRHWLNGSCGAAYRTALGGTARDRSLSTFTFAFFEPPAAARHTGARWVRCDLIASLPNGALSPLPSGTGPVLAHGVPDQYAVCLAPGTSNPVVTCAQHHALRGLLVFTWPGAKKGFPARAQLKQAADRRCQPLAGTRSWIWTAPSQALWAQGDRTVTCWVSDQVVGTET